MIEVKNVSKSFDGFKALDGLTMHVPDGSIYGLVGPNGAGKSTILRHITGIYRQDEGEIIVDGEPVFENPKIKNEIAYIPDDVFFYTQATIQDMMKFYRGVRPTFSEERYEKLREAFELNDKLKMRSLSELQENIAKVQLALPDGGTLPEGLNLLHQSSSGRLQTLIIRGEAEEITNTLATCEPLFMDVIPLSLEEIFIYELGGEHYEVKDIIL